MWNDDPNVARPALLAGYVWKSEEREQHLMTGVTEDAYANILEDIVVLSMELVKVFGGIGNKTTFCCACLKKLIVFCYNYSMPFVDFCGKFFNYLKLFVKKFPVAFLFSGNTS